MRRGTLASSAALVLALVGGLVAASDVSAQSNDVTAPPACDETLTPFSDIPASHPAAADVSCMYSLGVVKGTSATQFSPESTLTRAQMSVMMTRLWQALGNGCTPGASEPFTDVPAGHWAASEIACLYALEIVTGTSATQFSPDATLTRAPIAVMAARLWRTHGNACTTTTASFSDVPAGHWAHADIACLQDLGIMGAISGTMFKPDINASRLQMAMALARLWRSNSTAGTGSIGGTTTGGGGGGGGGSSSGQPTGSGQQLGGQSQATTAPLQQPQGVPNAPGSPSLTVGDGRLGVSFSWPPHTGAAFTGFRVWYCTSSGVDCSGAQTKNVQSSGSNPSTTIWGLTNGTQYYVRVRATNLNGTSEWSKASSATPIGAPGAPTSLVVSGGKSGNSVIGSGTLRVTWQHPTASSNTAAITGYRVRHSISGESWTSSTHSASSTSTTITGLADGTQYQVRVQATSSVGDGAWLQSAATPSTKPTAPAAPTVTGGKSGDNLVGSRTLNVSWTARTGIDTGGSTITGYDVQHRACTATPKSCTSNPTWDSWTTTTHSAATTSSSITGLTDGTAYQVRARAANSNGYSSWSPSGTATPSTTPTAPAAPTVSVPTSNNNGTKLSVSWSALTGTDTGGSAITGYDVHYRACTDTSSDTSLWCTGNNATWGSWTRWPHTGTTTYALITGLTKGTAIQVRVSAANSNGYSSWSPSGTATPSTVPAPPSEPSVSIPTDDSANQPPGETLSVSWTLPGTRPDDGGAPITGYEVQYRACTATPLWCTGNNPTWGSWTSWTHTGTTKSTEIDGLTKGTAIQVRVRATNIVGNSGRSSYGTAIPGTEPGTPGSVTVDDGVDVGSGKLNVSWPAPTNTGGLPITGYNVKHRACTATPKSCTTNPTWGSWTTTTHSAATTSSSITGLANGTKYQVQVRAVNIAGNSTWAPSTAATGTPEYYPSAPAAPSVVGGKSGNTFIGSGKLNISWSAPSDDGGHSISGYDVRYRVCTSMAGSFWFHCIGSNHAWGSWTSLSHTGTGTTASLDGLSNGVAIQVQVRAKNALGKSGWSEPGRGVPETKPRTPYHDSSGLDETVDGTSMRFTFCTKGTSTTCVSDDHGDNTITFDYQWKQCADSDAATACSTDWPSNPNMSVTYQLTPAKLTRDITGLTKGKKYGIRVRACNSLGCSAYSTMTLGTPHTVPGQPTITQVRWSTVENVTALGIQWTNPSDNGGKAIDGYDIFYFSSVNSNCSSTNPLGTGGGIWTRMTGTGTNPTSANILSGRAVQCKFWVYISVKNSAGYGWLSDIANTTPASVPNCTS